MATLFSSHNSQKPQNGAANTSQNIRPRLSKMLQLHGYSACREALVLLEDHFSSSTKYESMEDFISKLNRTITFDTDANTSIIDPDLAYLVIKKLCNEAKPQAAGNGDGYEEAQIEEESPQIIIPTNLDIRVKSVQYKLDEAETLSSTGFSANGEKQATDFNIHYNFLFKRLNTLPVFQGDFQLMKLATLTASSQPSIRCICFGLLVKDISKIDAYMLIDSTGRVPVKITPDTSFRNRLAYTNCIVLVEGVYVNPDDVLFAANIGLPPALLDPVGDKSLACVDEKLVIVLRELYLDDEDICEALEMLFTGYNSMEDPPALFILIGDFTREPCDPRLFRVHMRKLIRILKSCNNLKSSHFVFIPGQRDTSPNNNTVIDLTSNNQQHQQFANLNKTSNPTTVMPKCPLTDEQLPLNLLEQSGFEHVHRATNPCHIYLGERLISVVAHSYFKELQKNLLHDLSDHRVELFDTIKQIMLSNAHLAAGITKTYPSSMNLWHKPDLLLLADTEAFGNRYDHSQSSQQDTSFATLPSFSRQSNQFKVYCVKSGEIDDSQVSRDALKDIEEDSDCDDGQDQADGQEEDKIEEVDENQMVAQLRINSQQEVQQVDDDDKC